MVRKINPCLWFESNAEQAMHFYSGLFPNSAERGVQRYGPDQPMPEGTVLTASFLAGGCEFTAINGGPFATFTPAQSFCVTCQTIEEIDRLWAGLGEGGQVLMELGEYPFNKYYGWLSDRYGLSWQLVFSENARDVTPFLTFVGKQNGHAEEAINYYTSIFPNSSIKQIVRYEEGQGETAGNVTHGVFSIAGADFMASENSWPHNFTFSPAVSYFVECESQAEIDFFWERLSEGGVPNRCGWLDDKFGVTWQVVPTVLLQLMQDQDRDKANRVTQAMLKMTKIDIAALEAAAAIR
jgi:predicted 3-demethylubiquinone-9 3-methyltransferase (glyoxalase superfamily)